MLSVRERRRLSITFNCFRLRNGLTVVIHEDRSSPVAAIVVMYHVGSKNERPGRTGFAHLFEHVMFKGSRNIGDGKHFAILQEVGAQVNGSTTEDRTNYYESVPEHYLELALYLEADRMGFLLPALTRSKLDNQRDVVMNERRQHYDNQPYGTAHERILEALYPNAHPYHWPVIGSMDDLARATLADVKQFFRKYYAPRNAVLVVAGDVEARKTKEMTARLFGSLPSGRKPPDVRAKPVVLRAQKRLIVEDRVHLPRLYLVWPSAPGFTRTDAVFDVLTDILASGKSSRLYRTLVFEQQIAQSVAAYQNGSELAGTVNIEVTARPGISLSVIEAAVTRLLDEIALNGVAGDEIECSLNNKEAHFVARLTTSLGKANALATYATLTGNPENFNRELDRFKGITPGEIRRHVRRLTQSPRITLSVVPEGARELAAASESWIPQKSRAAR